MVQYLIDLPTAPYWGTWYIGLCVWVTDMMGGTSPLLHIGVVYWPLCVWVTNMMGGTSPLLHTRVVH